MEEIFSELVRSQFAAERAKVVIAASGGDSEAVGLVHSGGKGDNHAGFSWILAILKLEWARQVRSVNRNPVNWPADFQP